MSGPPRRRPALATPFPSLGPTVVLLAFAVAVVVTTEFIVVGLLPFLARDLGISIREAGRFVTWFALSSMILGPPLTIVARRVEPRHVLVLVLLVFGIGNLAAAAMPSYVVLAAVRVVQGAALPVFFSVGSATIAHRAGPGREGRALALINAGMVVGLVLAMPAGVFLADHAGWSVSFVGLAVMALVAALLIATTFPRLEHPGSTSMTTQAAIVGQPRFLAHLLLSALLFTAMFAGYTYLAAFLEVTTGFNGTRLALALVGFGAAGLAGNWAAGRLVGHGPTATTAGTALVLAVAMLAVSLAGGNLALLLPLLGVWGAAHAAAFVLCQVRVMLAGSSAPAFAASLNISACNLGIAVGAAAGGRFVESYGVGAIGFASAALAALAFAIAGFMTFGEVQTVARPHVRAVG